MNKDAILATVIGFIVGAVITGIILFGPTIIKALPNISLPALPSFLKKNQGSTDVVKNTMTEQPAKPDNGSGILKPENGAIVKDKKLLIEGMAAPETVVVIVSPVDETAVTADKDGAYQSEITLKEGYNLITAVYTSQNITVTSTREIYHTEEEL